MMCGYTKEQDQFLIENVKGITLKELTNRFNKKFGSDRSESSISNRKTKLGIRSGINGGQFQKGQKSFNKGKKWNDYMSEESQQRSRKTCFKKGNVPHNQLPIGTEILYEDGYIWVKIDDKPYVSKYENWLPKHLLIYKKHYGEVPDGHIVIFADGDRTNFDINNLMVVSRSESLYMNIHNLRFDDAEITKAGVLLTRINTKVKELEKEKDDG